MLIFGVLFCLLAGMDVQAAAPKGYSKTEYSSFSDVNRQIKAALKKEDVQGTKTIEKSTIKTIVGKKKGKTLFVCTTVKQDDVVISVETVSYIQKGKTIYSRTWGDGLLRPEYISKNSKYIFAGCYSLTSISIPFHNGYYLFHNCTNLNYVNISI